MCFSKFTQSIWIDYHENSTKGVARERRGTMSTSRSKIHNTLRNFLCGNRLQQQEVACVKRASAYTLPIIPAICKRNFFSVKAVILTFL